MKTVTHKLNSLTAVGLVDNTYDDYEERLKKNSRNGVSSLSDTYRIMSVRGLSGFPVLNTRRI
ncbi:MAG: hypothetical protein V8Q76_06945 [Bacteroides intestinalis]